MKDKSPVTYLTSLVHNLSVIPLELLPRCPRVYIWTPLHRFLQSDCVSTHQKRDLSVNVILGISTLASPSLITRRILSVDFLNLRCGFWWGFHVPERTCCSIQGRWDFLWVSESTFSSHCYFCTSWWRVSVMRYYNEEGLKAGLICRNKVLFELWIVT